MVFSIVIFKKTVQKNIFRFRKKSNSIFISCFFHIYLLYYR